MKEIKKRNKNQKSFWKKGLFGEFLNYQSGMCDELKEQWDKAKVESDKQPNGILSSRRHGSLAKRLKERVNEKSLCPKG